MRIILLTIIGVLLARILTRALRRAGPEMRWVALLFFLSGFPALIYQIVWQRSLFTAYGVNIESVTIVVGAFMAGLGIGSLVGGYLSRRYVEQSLLLFCAAELSIGVYGLLSLRIFRLVEAATAGAPMLATGALAFSLVLVPTLMMGATLPLLSGYAVRRFGVVGRAVGVLYEFNTFGSAIACFIAAGFLLRTAGLAKSVTVAAALNLCTAAGVFVLSRQPKSPAPRMDSVDPPSRSTLPVSLGALLAGLCGFMALGYEILWYRVFSFASGGTAQTFALLLGAYLLGIAAASGQVETSCVQWQRKDGAYVLRTMGLLMLLATLVSFCVVPLVARWIVWLPLAAGLPLVAVAAGLLGALFPLTCHASIPPDQNSGLRVSYIYFSNIVGSVAGSLLLGFVLMNTFPLHVVAVILALLGIVGAAVLFISGLVGRKARIMAVVGSAASAVLVVAISGTVFSHAYERLLYKSKFDNAQPFSDLVETRSGVVAVDQEDVVYGGGVYDGQFRTDLVKDDNLLVRAFAIAAMHPSPKSVLMIGLASGSWAQVIAHNPDVERLTIIEINPGYLRLIRSRPVVASLLTNPKVRIIIDDGRRWMLAHPEEKFDFMVCNTTFHWRDHASSLLSTDFLRLIRQHLQPGGIHFYNTTGSADALLTGVTVFPYAVRFLNFLAVSDRPIPLDRERWARVLANYEIDGKPVLHLDRDSDRQRLNEVLAMLPLGDDNGAADKPVERAAALRRRLTHAHLITDDNMGSEWKYTEIRNAQ